MERPLDAFFRANAFFQRGKGRGNARFQRLARIRRRDGSFSERGCQRMRSALAYFQRGEAGETIVFRAMNDAESRFQCIFDIRLG